LLGEHHTVRQTVAAPGSQDAALRGALAHARTQGHGIVVRITIPGARSRIGSFSSLVYLPAQ